MTLEEILATASRAGSSDIHIEHSQTGIAVLYRTLGKLRKLIDLSADEKLLNRIKMKANLDLSESRRVQEGQFTFVDQGKNWFVRVSIVASIRGEKVALRLLPEKQQLSLDELNIPSNLLTQLKLCLQKTSGLVLVCGATGAGKSTTLYACLDALNNGQRSIFTIEDPVEYELAGIYQCEPNLAISLDAVALLKAFLRQDPDIIMVGEIRDAKTANLAVNAALTGHLVFATLHTNSALDAIHRCHTWQVDFFSLVSSIRLIIHQSMHYGDNKQHARFNAIQPNWTSSLPTSYTQLIQSSELWQVL